MNPLKPEKGEQYIGPETGTIYEWMGRNGLIPATKLVCWRNLGGMLSKINLLIIDIIFVTVSIMLQRSISLISIAR
jgi:hypothetical protein